MRKDAKIILLSLFAAMMAAMPADNAAIAGFDWTPPSNEGESGSAIQVRPQPRSAPERTLRATPEPQTAPRPQRGAGASALQARPVTPVERRTLPQARQPVRTQAVRTPVTTGATSSADFPLIDLHPLNRPQNRGIIEQAAHAPPEPLAYPDEEVPEKPVIKQQKKPDYEDATGFGNGIPLALAAGQIIPPEYTYAFSENVDPGTRIDWKGGRPWNIVLKEALAPQGLAIEWHGSSIRIIPDANGHAGRRGASRRQSGPFSGEG